MFNFCCRVLIMFLFVSVAYGQTSRVVVIPLGGGEGGDDVSDCVVDSCGAGMAMLTCSSGVVEIPCLAEDKRVFITSTTHNGNLGGLDGANAICQGLATTHGLSGEFKAWISGISNNPSEMFVQSAVPYVLLDGTRIANNWGDLVDGSPLAADICIDEGGNSAICDTVAQVWTNTRFDGVVFNNINTNSHCDNWSDTSTTGIAGTAVFTDVNGPEQWTSVVRPSCAEQLHLYCFEQ